MHHLYSFHVISICRATFLSTYSEVNMYTLISHISLQACSHHYIPTYTPGAHCSTHLASPLSLVSFLNGLPVHALGATLHHSTARIQFSRGSPSYFPIYHYPLHCPAHPYLFYPHWAFLFQLAHNGLFYVYYPRYLIFSYSN